MRLESSGLGRGEKVKAVAVHERVEETNHMAADGVDEYLLASWQQLLAVRSVEVQGLAVQAAADLAEGVHVIQDAGRGDYCTVDRGEVDWWSVGYADGRDGAGDLVLEAMTVPLPEMVPPEEAADLLSSVDRWGIRRGEAMSVDGIRYMIQTGVLYPLYGLRRRRSLFMAQVTAVAAAREVKVLERDPATKPATLVKARRAADRTWRRWEQILELLPELPRRPDTLPAAARPQPSPDPLPIRGVAMSTKAHRALLRGHDLGWFDYRGVEQPVKIAGVKRDLQGLPPISVLAWVYGVGFALGEGYRVAYRDGQG